MHVVCCTEMILFHGRHVYTCTCTFARACMSIRWYVVLCFLQLPDWAKPIAKAVMSWVAFDHAFRQNTLLDGDTYFLHVAVSTF